MGVRSLPLSLRICITVSKHSLDIASNDVPSGIFTELPVAGVDELRLRPDTARPSLTLNGRKWTIDNVTGRDGNEV